MKWIEPPQGIITVDELESYMISAFEGKTKSIYDCMNNGFSDVLWDRLTDKEKQEQLDHMFNPMREHELDGKYVIEAYSNEEGILQVRWIKKEAM